jgi:hypothetical protein
VLHGGNPFVAPNVSPEDSVILETVLAKPFVLNCTDFAIESASIGAGRSGATFRCTLSRVGEETLDALDDTVRSGGRIRFAFPKHPLVLGGVEVARVGPGRVRIAGRVMEA